VEDLKERLASLKDELEDTIGSHKAELRTMDAKAHDQWVKPCKYSPIGLKYA